MCPLHVQICGHKPVGSYKRYKWNQATGRGSEKFEDTDYHSPPYSTFDEEHNVYVYVQQFRDVTEENSWMDRRSLLPAKGS